MEVKVKKLHEDAVVPNFAHAGDAGADLVSIEDVEIGPGERRLVKTGIAIELPPYTEAQVRSRSGLALKHGIIVLNAPGTIDFQYRGEVGVILFNSQNPPSILHEDALYKGMVQARSFKVEKGMRIAQIVINKLPEIEYVEVEELSDTDRGEGGFGSTGK